MGAYLRGEIRKLKISLRRRHENGKQCAFEVARCRCIYAPFTPIAAMTYRALMLPRHK